MSKLEAARVLLDHGANIHAKNTQGQTPLHIVSQGVAKFPELYEPALVELLLSRGADLNERDNDKATPFLLVTSVWKIKTAEILLQNDADVNAVNIHGQNALHLLSQNPNIDQWQLRSLSKLLEGGVDMNGRDNDERTPLHLACYCGQVDVAEALLEHAAQINAKDTWGHTALHLVTLGIVKGPQDLSEHPRKVIRLAKQLLESGADVNAKNEDYETPLHIASRLRLHDIARLLLKHGADVNMMNSEGRTPLQLATGRKGRAMRRLLSEWGTVEYALSVDTIH